MLVKVFHWIRINSTITEKDKCYYSVNSLNYNDLKYSVVTLKRSTFNHLDTINISKPRLILISFLYDRKHLFTFL
jgi:hypothetical protein